MVKNIPAGGTGQRLSILAVAGSDEGGKGAYGEWVDHHSGGDGGQEGTAAGHFNGNRKSLP